MSELAVIFMVPALFTGMFSFAGARFKLLEAATLLVVTVVAVGALIDTRSVHGIELAAFLLIPTFGLYFGLGRLLSRRPVVLAVVWVVTSVGFVYGVLALISSALRAEGD